MHIDNLAKGERQGDPAFVAFDSELVVVKTQSRPQSSPDRFCLLQVSSHPADTLILKATTVN